MKRPADIDRARKGTTRFRTLALLVAGALGSGCAVIPLPTGRHVPAGFLTRGPIRQSTLESVQAGVTTRADVLLLLGEPDRAWGGQRSLLYRWTTSSGYWLWILAGGYQGVGGAVPFGRRPHELLLEFDQRGVVSWMGDIRTWRSGPGTREALPDSVQRVELPVQHRHSADAQPGALTLGDDGISFDERGRPGHEVTIACDRVRSLEHDVIEQQAWANGGAGCTLIYTTADRQLAERRLHLIVEVESLPILHRYLERRCPQASIGT